MIARVWRGETRAEDADRYLDYLRRTGLPDARATPGNRGVQIQRRIVGDRAGVRLHLLLGFDGFHPRLRGG